MPTIVQPRPFIPGTLGWTVDDLDWPPTAQLWDEGAYEIVDGVEHKRGRS